MQTLAKQVLEHATALPEGTPLGCQRTVAPRQSCSSGSSAVALGAARRPVACAPAAVFMSCPIC